MGGVVAFVAMLEWAIKRCPTPRLLLITAVYVLLWTHGPRMMTTTNVTAWLIWGQRHTRDMWWCAHGFVLENRSRRTDQFGWWTSVAHKNTLASKTTVTEVHDSTHHLDEWICNQLTFAFIQMSKYGNVDGHRPTKNATNLSNMIDQLFNTRYHCTTG